MRALAPSARLADAIALHWPEYLFEGIEFAFMLAACSFGTLLFYTRSPVSSMPSATVRLVFMGLAMGATAIAIILSPMGRRSGAHFNPIVSFTFFCLGRMHRLDALFYVGRSVSRRSTGRTCGTDSAWCSSRLSLGALRGHGSRPLWVPAALLAECFMGLLTDDRRAAERQPCRALSRFTWLLVGLLVTLYVIAFSPVSGFSLNPARTVSSAIFAGVWTAMWLYFSAPVSGMLLAASLYVLTSGSEAVLCAKIYHDLHSPCPFRCRFLQHEPAIPDL